MPWIFYGNTSSGSFCWGTRRWANPLCLRGSRMAYTAMQRTLRSVWISTPVLQTSNPGLKSNYSCGIQPDKKDSGQCSIYNNNNNHHNYDYYYVMSAGYVSMIWIECEAYITMILLHRMTESIHACFCDVIGCVILQGYVLGQPFISQPMILLLQAYTYYIIYLRGSHSQAYQ